ncbi:L-serine ammonia-lyase, iron-sulfur-dependent subunit beta [Clostridium hydrogeniformans]|uniref:L-serine ammonia-lyase, iron-sulfur-dependent subunit beta n=1 Tax=Clostridium hydrogeniformans TaxID=349933 RepID=UPI00048497CE|nr:L-serine ammonia-lyase, iron-sulfur-dependent subunit beta [Clostridium hydrogeniformans]
MKRYGVFDIIGPIMIGPSSSHTAGAARLSKIAGIIAGENIKKVTFLLHGSFAKTYKGHGTDRALVAGILGMNPWDEGLRDSLVIAKDKGIEIVFKEADLGEVHPNTVKFVIEKEDGYEAEVMGSSIGGGSIIITEVDGQKVEFTGEYPTLIIDHRDAPGVVSKVTAILYDNDINIAFMKVFRSSRGRGAAMIFETDHNITKEIKEEILSIKEINHIKIINPMKEGE